MVAAAGGSIPGAPISYQPRGAENEKGSIDVDENFSAYGIQTIQSAACKANFVPQIFQHFNFDTGEQNPYNPRERKAENGKMEFPQPE